MLSTPLLGEQQTPLYHFVLPTASSPSRALHAPATATPPHPPPSANRPSHTHLNHRGTSNLEANARGLMAWRLQNRLRSAAKASSDAASSAAHDAEASPIRGARPLAILCLAR
mmetsp:Transcript_84844/g.169526  ORF Transcript_84844/g.169526 Transcript_84844/m.169526 type:complete len:113 (+) Transcript_84844:545-883(+)